MEDLEPIPPNDLGKFSQERLDKMSEILDKTLLETGFKKMMREMFHEELAKPVTLNLTLSEIVERYGSVLTEKEFENITNLLKKDGKEKNRINRSGNIQP